MKIHHLNCGTMCPIGQRLVNGSGSVFATGRLVCHCWLIETDLDGLILVDTGYGTECVRQRAARWGTHLNLLLRPKFDFAETALHQIQALGFQPEEVRHIIPTHLDMDHVGGLSDFPNAKVHTYRPEFDAAMARSTFFEKSRYRPIMWEHKPKWEVHDLAGEAWHGLESVRTLDKNDRVLMVPLIGHTRGHCGVAVQTSEGWALHAGDAYFYHDEMSTPPSRPWVIGQFQSQFAYDDGARRSNQSRLRELKASNPEIRIHCAHSAVEFDAS